MKMCTGVGRQLPSSSIIGLSQNKIFLQNYSNIKSREISLAHDLFSSWSILLKFSHNMAVSCYVHAFKTLCITEQDVTG